MERRRNRRYSVEGGIATGTAWTGDGTGDSSINYRWHGRHGDTLPPAKTLSNTRLLRYGSDDVAMSKHMIAHDAPQCRRRCT